MPPKSTKSRKTKVKKEVVIDTNDEQLIDYEPVVESVKYQVGMTHGQVARLEKKLRREKNKKND